MAEQYQVRDDNERLYYLRRGRWGLYSAEIARFLEGDISELSFIEICDFWDITLRILPDGKKIANEMLIKLFNNLVESNPLLVIEFIGQYIRIFNEDPTGIDFEKLFKSITIIDISSSKSRRSKIDVITRILFHRIPPNYSPETNIESPLNEEVHEGILRRYLEFTNLTTYFKENFNSEQYRTLYDHLFRLCSFELEDISKKPLNADLIKEYLSFGWILNYPEIVSLDELKVVSLGSVYLDKATNLLTKFFLDNTEVDELTKYRIASLVAQMIRTEKRKIQFYFKSLDEMLEIIFSSNKKRIESFKSANRDILVYFQEN